MAIWSRGTPPGDDTVAFVTDATLNGVRLFGSVIDTEPLRAKHVHGTMYWLEHHARRSRARLWHALEPQCAAY